MSETFERFDAWQRCHELVLKVYSITEDFPSSELYGLTSQARRAAFSAAANIAEGSAKRGQREFARYLDISIGSLTELAYTLMLTRDLGFLSLEDYAEVKALKERASIKTWKLYRSLDRRGGGRG